MLLSQESAIDVLGGWVFFSVSVFLGVIAWLLYQEGESIKSVAAALFFLPFFCVGFHWAIGQYPWDAYVRRHTRYALSNFRGFIETSVFGKVKLKTYPINPFIPLSVDTYAGGTVWLAEVLHEGHEGNSLERIGFIGIPDYRKVYDLIRSLQIGES